MEDLYTREEYIVWAQSRARQYVNLGDLHNAVASITSDMQKHAATRLDPKVFEHIKQGTSLLMMHAEKAAIDRWIDGFTSL